MLNRAILMGRLTAAPELKRTNSGTSVTSFTIAVDRDFKTKDGERQTDFINCVAWKATAEFICKHFSKGSLAAVSGSLQSRKWTDKEGNSRTATELQVESIYFAGAKRESSGEEYADAEPLREISDDGDLPF